MERLHGAGRDAEGNRRQTVEASIEAVNTPSVREKLVQSGIVPGGTTPGQVAERFKADKQVFADAVKVMGIKGE